MWEIWANWLLPKALKSCPKLLNQVTLLPSKMFYKRTAKMKYQSLKSPVAQLQPLNYVLINVTRFGKISPLWQKCRNIGNIFKVHLVLGKVVNPLWHNLYAHGQRFIVVNGQILKKQSGHQVTLVLMILVQSVGLRSTDFAFKRWIDLTNKLELNWSTQIVRKIHFIWLN